MAYTSAAFYFILYVITITTTPYHTPASHGLEAVLTPLSFVCNSVMRNGVVKGEQGKEERTGAVRDRTNERGPLTSAVHTDAVNIYWMNSLEAFTRCKLISRSPGVLVFNVLELYPVEYVPLHSTKETKNAVQ
jgi:hypothetical protein